MKVIGVMSGTSYDAIETAAADLSLEDDTLVLRPLGSRSFDYADDLRAQIAAALPPAPSSAEALCTALLPLLSLLRRDTGSSSEAFTVRPARLVRSVIFCSTVPDATDP